MAVSENSGIVGVSPQIIPILIGVFHPFSTIHFGGFPPYFWGKHPYNLQPDRSPCCFLHDALKDLGSGLADGK